MNHPDISLRSPHLMNADDTALLVIDMQEKILPHIHQNHRIVWNTRRLVESAHLLKMEVGHTEQYPKGLGKTVDPISMLMTDRGSQPAEKTMFSCRECGQLFQKFAQQGIQNLLLCGIETHVCVAQTALDLLAANFNIYVAVDAVGSRFQIDHQTALQRLQYSGVVLTTTEAAMFEWCQNSKSNSFKQISRLAQEKLHE
ncbi:MAG: hydrolase [Planctomycetota bacterium]